MDACNVLFTRYGWNSLLARRQGRTLRMLSLTMKDMREQVKREYARQQEEMARKELLQHHIRIKEVDGLWTSYKCTDVEAGGEAICFALLVTVCGSNKEEVRHIFPDTEIVVGGWF